MLFPTLSTHNYLQNAPTRTCTRPNVLKRTLLFITDYLLVISNLDYQWCVQWFGIQLFKGRLFYLCIYFKSSLINLPPILESLKSKGDWSKSVVYVCLFWCLLQHIGWYCWEYVRWSPLVCSEALELIIISETRHQTPHLPPTRSYLCTELTVVFKWSVIKQIQQELWCWRKMHYFDWLLYLFIAIWENVCCFRVMINVCQLL